MSTTPSPGEVVADVPNSLLFRFRVDCPQYSDAKSGAVELPASFELPTLGEFSREEKPFASLRSAWSSEGLYFSLIVRGKKQALRCQHTRMLESDSLQLWIDTRDTHNVHRATKFCHWFSLLPLGNPEDPKQPLATMLHINRAREHSPSVNQVPVQIASKIRKTGYTLNAFIPARTLNGFNVDEYRMLGFNYQVTDSELGVQCLSVGPEYPIAEDPSLWGTLALV